MSFTLGDITGYAAHAWHECPYGKKPYATKQDAHEALKRIEDQFLVQMNVYKCQFCEYYHLGNRRGRGRR